MIKKYYNYYVIELKLNGYYQYYLGKDNYGNLFHMFGTEQRFTNLHDELIKAYILCSRAERFWK